MPRRSAAAIALVRAFWAAQFAVMVTAMVTNSHALVEQATPPQHLLIRSADTVTRSDWRRTILGSDVARNVFLGTLRPPNGKRGAYDVF